MGGEEFRGDKRYIVTAGSEHSSEYRWKRVGGAVINGNAGG